MESLLSPRTVATALGVSESSVKRWVDGGELAAVRTVGGHRRVARAEALRFARTRCLFPARPELLEPVALHAGDATLSESQRGEAFHEALLEGHRPRVLSLLQSAFVAGTSVAQLCDATVRLALARIGERWKHSEEGIFLEHRATDLCLQALGALRAALPPVPEHAPVALGSAGPEDPYLLPSMMCATVLAETGFRDINLGAKTPMAAKLAAIEACRPTLVWHSSSIEGEELASVASSLARNGRSDHPRWVVGGRALAERSWPPGLFTVLSDMGELQAFALALFPAHTGGTSR